MKPYEYNTTCVYVFWRHSNPVDQVPERTIWLFHSSPPSFVPKDSEITPPIRVFFLGSFSSLISDAKTLSCDLHEFWYVFLETLPLIFMRQLVSDRLVVGYHVTTPDCRFRNFWELPNVLTFYLRHIPFVIVQVQHLIKERRMCRRRTVVVAQNNCPNVFVIIIRVTIIVWSLCWHS